jgi:pyridoxal phosphate enzyme (YggS family)
MAVNREQYRLISGELKDRATLVAVSKTKPAADILELYELGHRDFGENYVQELLEKSAQLPTDIRWHFIGHLQTNKVKFIIPFVQLIHGVDSLKLLKEIHKQAEKTGRQVSCLLQVHIAQEETKFGLSEEELEQALGLIGQMPSVNVQGLMGMASFTEDLEKVRQEFRHLKSLYDRCNRLGAGFTILSMGMSGDYRVALEEGSTLVRIGSLLFGARVKNEGEGI